MATAANLSATGYVCSAGVHGRRGRGQADPGVHAARGGELRAVQLHQRGQHGAQASERQRQDAAS